jgi:hypothetical protein
MSASTQAELLVELETLAGRLDLCLSRLADATDPLGVRLIGQHAALTHASSFAP